MVAIRGLVIGNAREDGAATRGWVFGQFMPDAPHRREDFEVKWGVHPRGEREAEGWVANRTSATLSVLVEGTFRLRMRRGGEVQEVWLRERGDYALWEPGVEHTWEATTDCVVLSVRCPSVPSDQRSSRD